MSAFFLRCKPAYNNDNNYHNYNYRDVLLRTTLGMWKLVSRVTVLADALSSGQRSPNADKYVF